MDELEDLLQRYRPSGPPPELRDRITSASERDVTFADRDVAQPFRAARVIEWLPAAAAVVLAVLFHWLAANEQQMVDAHFTPIPPIVQAALELEHAQR